MKTLIQKILFYSFLASIAVIFFFILIIFNYIKNILLSENYEEEVNMPQTNILGQDIKQAKLAHWPIEDEFPDLFK